jgi:hypothetical protein
MINIKVDANGTRSVLQALADERTRDRVLEAMGESYVDDTLSFIDSGESFTSRTGRLRGSIQWVPNGDQILVSASVLKNGLDYAPLVEFGHPLKNQKGNTRPFPFLFADAENRRENMLDAARSVLYEVLNADY